MGIFPIDNNSLSSFIELCFGINAFGSYIKLYEKVKKVSPRFFTKIVSAIQTMEIPHEDKGFKRFKLISNFIGSTFHDNAIKSIMYATLPLAFISSVACIVILYYGIIDDAAKFCFLLILPYPLSFLLYFTLVFLIYIILFFIRIICRKKVDIAKKHDQEMEEMAKILLDKLKKMGGGSNPGASGA